MPLVDGLFPQDDTRHCICASGTVPLHRDDQPCSQSNLTLDVSAISVLRASLQAVIGGRAISAQGSNTCTLPHDLLARGSGIVQLSLRLLQAVPLPKPKRFIRVATYFVLPLHP
jgi:hypothetical protein